MDEYIEREEAMHIAFKSPFFSDALMEEMKAIPAADVAPVRHGRWVLDEKRYVVYCSECSEPVSYYPNIRDVREENHYCPNCGAKMDLEG